MSDISRGEEPATSLYANFGAEEQRDAKRAGRELLRLVSLWHRLFPQDPGVVLPRSAFPPGTEWTQAELPSAASQRGILSGWLFAQRGSIPWLPNEEWASAARSTEATAANTPTTNPTANPTTNLTTNSVPDPRVVREVHDKAFTAGVAPTIARTTWSMLSKALEPEELEAEHIEEIMRGWPSKWRQRFVLKPRIGTSGRGRVDGADGRLDDAGRRGLSKLAARGGAILEPWFERVQDLSAQYWVDSAGRIDLLGTTQQILGENGIYLGNEGVFFRGEDGHFEVRSGHWSDSRLIHDSIRLVERAAGGGFRGPCGIDAFTYRDHVGGEVREVLRSLVELNARYTTGTVALGWLEIVASSVSPETPISGEWRFLFAPDMVRRFLGDGILPKTEDGWLVFDVGPSGDPAMVALRLESS